jgi:hypothetical protein
MVSDPSDKLPPAVAMAVVPLTVTAPGATNAALLAIRVCAPEGSPVMPVVAPRVTELFNTPALAAARAEVPAAVIELTSVTFEALASAVVPVIVSEPVRVLPPLAVSAVAAVRVSVVGVEA